MRYKLIIYGNNMFKEVLLDEAFSGSLTIGTEKACQVAFRKERFCTEFVMRIERGADGSYIISCSDTIYFYNNSGVKEYARYLVIGEHVIVCYDSTNEAFFFVDFFAAYERVGEDFDCCIDCRDYNEFTIGGTTSTTIRINDANVGEDCIRLRRVLNGYEVDTSGIFCGVEINGFEARGEIGYIREGEFLTLKGYVFCFKNGFAYTTRLISLTTELVVEMVSNKKNHLEYPKFIRNARQQYKMPSENIEILSPKAKDESEEQNFLLTVLPMLINMLLMVGLRGIMGGGGTFVLYFAATMTVSTTISIISFMRDKKKRVENEKKREIVYMKYLSAQEDNIIQLRDKEQVIANMMNPNLDEYMTFIEEFDNRLFEKEKEHDDFLSVRLGDGVVPSVCQVEYKQEDYVDTDDGLKDYPKAIHDKYQYLDRMPILLHLKDVNAVGFIGTRTKLYQMEKNLIMEFAASHFYKDVKLFLIMEEQDVKLFSWARWLKMTYNEETRTRNFMYDEESAKVSLEFLYSELSRRESMGKIDKEMPDYIVLVYKSQVISTHPVSKYINVAKNLGFHFIFFEEFEEFIHPACSMRVFLNEQDYTGYIQEVENGENLQSFLYSHIRKSDAEKAAKKLAGVYVDEVNLENTLTKNITLYELLHIMSPYDLNLAKNWQESRIYESMAAPIGVKSGNEMVYLDLHEKHHGPHGLVAGTTGSGKSEILQTYILSMATLFHPYEVGFIIIDFKGGGMVNQFRDLPHLNGAITNIDGNEIDRSLLSIRAELMKRQELFARYDVNHIDDYIRLYKEGKTQIPLPHLILIVDEFAELKSEQPEFMKELISASRIGRSLGVHLILATQKPSGVVSDQIWSNSKFKLCLKVQNKGDSNEVLKSPLAAEIKEPGRAYLQVGNNEIFQLFQSAYSGASAKTDDITAQKSFVISRVELSGRRSVIYEQKSNKDDGGETQLRTMVNYINEYCMHSGIPKLPDICLPPLPENIPFSLDNYAYEGTDIVVPIGLTDNPSKQQQYTEYLNLSQNNFYILGSSQSGKTNLLQTIIRGLGELYAPWEVNIYILDFASLMLRNYSQLNHVGAVITANDEERLKGFLKLIQTTIQERKTFFSKIGLSSYSAYRESGQSELPQIVVLLDNWVAFRSFFPDYEETIINISRDSIAVGISLIVTAGQVNGVGYKLLANFNRRTVLYCNDSSDYSSVLESCRKKLPNMPGRAFVENNKEYFECQYYLAFAAEKEYEKIDLVRSFVAHIQEKYGDVYANGIREIPEEVTDVYLARQYGENTLTSYEIPIGMEFDSVELRTLSLDKLTYYAFVGSENSGKDAYVEYLLGKVLSEQQSAPVELYIVDDTKKKLAKYEPYAVTYTTDILKLPDMLEHVSDIAKERTKLANQNELSIEREALQLIVVNSFAAVKQICADRELNRRYKEVVGGFKGLKCCLLYTDIENTPISFSSGEILKNIRDGRNMLIFEDIKAIQIVDVPMMTTRKFKKQLGYMDAYLVNGETIEKIRTVKGYREA